MLDKVKELLVFLALIMWMISVVIIGLKLLFVILSTKIILMLLGLTFMILIMLGFLCRIQK